MAGQESMDGKRRKRRFWFNFGGKVKKEEIQKKLPNRNWPAVNRQAAKLKLIGNPSLAHQIYERNESFFDVPNAINSYYAGWIASDGSVSILSGEKMRVEIALQEKDVEMLERFKKESGYTGPIQKLKRRPVRIGKNKKMSFPQNQVRLQICCKQWVISLLKNWNITENKTLSYIGPNLSTCENNLAFCLGYIEGDGFIGVRNLNGKRVPYFGLYSSSLALMQIIKSIFDKLFPNINSAEIYKTKNSPDFYSYQITGCRAIEILRVLYELPTPHLKRKWDNSELLSFLYPNKNRAEPQEK